MFLDARIRQILDGTVPSYVTKVGMDGPFHKTYTASRLTVLVEAVTGEKVVGHESVDMARIFYPRNFYPDHGHRNTKGEMFLVTDEEAREQRSQEEKRRQYNQNPHRRVKDVVAVIERDPKTKVDVVVTGPIVASLDDTALETINAKRILVRYDGVDLNKEYFDPPWWRTLIEQAKERYGVQIDSPKEGYPHYLEARPGMPGIHLHRPRESRVFRLEASEETDAETAIKSVWEAGQSVQRASKGEEERLMSYL